jgi:endo-1,4-beta-xylanase
MINKNNITMPLHSTVNRRKFLKRGGAGLLSSTLLPLSGLSAPTQGSVAKLLAYDPSDTDKELLEKARKNIDRIRKREVELTLLDKMGSPLRNQEVSVQQLKHQFLFGDVNWSMATLERNDMIDHDRAQYMRKRFADVLNSLNTTVYWTERPRNDGTKTEDFQGDVRLDDFEESVNWANANGIVAKGHPIFWTVPKAIPEWLKKYPIDTFMKFVEVRVRSLCARFAGRVQVWDAVNEMLWETHPKNLSQRVWPYTETVENMADYIGKVLRWGREEDPEALFCINDYGLSKARHTDLVDQNGDKVDTQRQRKRLLELVDRLGQQGQPPSLLGIQGRPAWLTPGEQVALYDELGEAGIPLTMTEWWAGGVDHLKRSGVAEKIESEEWRILGDGNVRKNLSDEELEEVRDQFVLDYLTIAFGHPHIDSFYFWGFMGGAVNFKPGTTSSHTLKPIYHKVRKRIHEDWKTALDLKTDNDGKIRFRGFCGDYTARVAAKGSEPKLIGMKFRVDRDTELNRATLRSVL